MSEKHPEDNHHPTTHHFPKTPSWRWKWIATCNRTSDRMGNGHVMHIPRCWRLWQNVSEVPKNRYETATAHMEVYKYVTFVILPPQQMLLNSWHVACCRGSIILWPCHPDCDCIIAVDFNADLNSCTDDVANYVNSFITIHRLSHCDSLTVYEGQPTYVNFALNRQSCTDFVLTANAKNTVNFDALLALWFWKGSHKYGEFCFPQLTVKGCSFHFWQTLMHHRWHGKFGLALHLPFGNWISLCPQWLREIMAVSMLPTFAEPLAWQIMKQHPVTGSSTVDSQRASFVEYLNTTWVTGDFLQPCA